MYSTLSNPIPLFLVEISALYPGPYYSYYDWDPYVAPMRPPLESLADSLADSHDHLDSLLLPAEEGGMGPFDGLLGFSQGAALVMSYLVWRECQNAACGSNANHDSGADAGTSVRFAAFFCGSRPWDRKGMMRLGAREFGASPALGLGLPDSGTCSTDGSDGGETERAVVPSVKLPQILRKLSIPTTHVLGAQDIWLEESRQLLGMCDSKEVVAWEHNLGHVIPMDKKSSQHMCDMFRKVVRRADFQQ
ncbi:hypothetical protein DL764_005849 [Monosporascus ibericus]|uniref:Serine hydrolase domain-containing protein n=1 Tax=Monosporascus ibericus TaxID=155417 RepID=A0A4Q4TB03_9PEZI|nr:hypothetical protein DL764_005849 [Monosporascus ibericus]